MNWKKILLRKSCTIDKAIQILDNSGLQIILVVDVKKTLLGTITDGDIRRALIHKIDLNSPISKIMSRKPLVAYIDDSDEYILKKMRELKLNNVPILNNDKKVMGLKSIEELIDRKIFNNPVILMAGGFGKRLVPLTKKTPKPLLKIKNTPMLEIIIKKLISHGFVNFYISVHYKANLIKDYFKDGSKWDINIKYLEEKTPMGTAGGLSLLDKSNKIPILVMNSDILTNLNFRDLLEFHMLNKSDGTVCVREEKYQQSFGVVELRNNKLSKIIEKPITKFFINAGIYIINANVLKRKAKKFQDMPTFLNNLVKKKKTISVYPIYESWDDIGTISNYNNATKADIKI